MPQIVSNNGFFYVKPTQKPTFSLGSIYNMSGKEVRYEKKQAVLFVLKRKRYLSKTYHVQISFCSNFIYGYDLHIHFALN